MPARDLKAYLAAQEKKSLLRFLTCGSVDDGKSTLIGKLLYETKMIYEDQLAAIQKDSKKHGTTGEETGIACSEVPIGGGVNAGNIKKCLAFLKETGWNGVVSLECYGADDNIRQSVEFLRPLT